MSSIRITSCPVGEEPKKVRQAWVGLEFSLTSLPLMVKQGFPEGSGLFLGPRKAYAVSFQTAISRLDLAQRSEAVDWWRDNHREEYFCPDSIILFHHSCCEYLP